MNIKKNRLVIPLNKSCDYCNINWGLMDEDDWLMAYYDPEDDSVICKACHLAYGPADSKEEPE